MAEGLPFSVICKLGFENDKATTVTVKGIMSLIGFSEERGCLELNAYLINQMCQPIGVHKNCRRDFTNRRRACALEHDQLPQPKRLIKIYSSILSFRKLHALWEIF